MSRTALDTDATRTARIQEVRYALNLEGVSPLIMNSNTGLLEPQDKGRDPEARDRAQLVIPARAINNALVQACKFMVRKPKGVSFKSYAPFIESAALVPHDALLDVDLAAVIPFSIVVNLDPSKGNKGPRGPRTRPMIPLPWCATGEVIVFDRILSEDVLQEIAERAGKQVGLLDGRAIDFGRCLVTLARLD